LVVLCVLRVLLNVLSVVVIEESVNCLLSESDVSILSRSAALDCLRVESVELSLQCFYCGVC